jgi:hypothetical protein
MVALSLSLDVMLADGPTPSSPTSCSSWASSSAAGSSLSSATSPPAKAGFGHDPSRRRWTGRASL